MNMSWVLSGHVSAPDSESKFAFGAFMTRPADCPLCTIPNPVSAQLVLRAPFQIQCLLTPACKVPATLSIHHQVVVSLMLARQHTHICDCAFAQTCHDCDSAREPEATLARHSWRCPRRDSATAGGRRPGLMIVMRQHLSNSFFSCLESACCEMVMMIVVRQHLTNSLFSCFESACCELVMLIVVNGI